MPTIKETWNDKRGDMLYGMGPEINRYLQHLYDLKGNYRQVADAAHVLKESNYAAINTVNTALSGDRFTAHHGTVTVTTPTSHAVVAQRYLAALNAHGKFKPARSAGDVGANPALLAALRKGQSTLAPNSPDRALAAAAKELAIRRSCKFGIDYSVKTGAQIHYILDGLDMKIVAAKDLLDKTIRMHHGPDLHFKKVSICTSELRFLFRNWQRLAPTKQVRFYSAFKETLAPWTHIFWAPSLPHWAEYAAHRVEKAIARIRANSRDLGGIYLQQFMLKECEAFRTARATGKTALEQITLFHKIPSALVND